MAAPTTRPRYSAADDDTGRARREPLRRPPHRARADEQAKMLAALGFGSLDELVDAAVPDSIADRRSPCRRPPTRPRRSPSCARSPPATGARPLIGLGYYDTITPPVIQRNVLENPAWYTAYTPYQPEISQGRLEALLNFQTMVSDLTGMDSPTRRCSTRPPPRPRRWRCCAGVDAEGAAIAFFVDADCHPQTIAVVRTRAEPLGIEVVVGDAGRATACRTATSSACCCSTRAPAARSATTPRARRRGARRAARSSRSPPTCSR